jgi:hypothetical protein
MTRSLRLRPVTFTTALLLLAGAGGCGSTQKSSPETPANQRETPATADKKKPRIVGEIESVESPRRKRMRIWGRVEKIISAKHGQLPPLQKVSDGGVGDPVAEIVNETQFELTIWFAGKCAHKTKVPPRGKITAVFCPGSYHIAAMVDNKEYLPLVRENQKFDGGVGYQLKVIIKKRPTSDAK